MKSVEDATTVKELFCQTAPRLTSKNMYWPDDQETDSVEGYQRFGKKWNSCLFEANKITGRHFQWLINVNFVRPISIQEIKDRKNTLLNNLGRNKELSLFWRLQINDSNTSLVHLHFAALDRFTDDQAVLTNVFEKACAFFRKEARIFIEPIRNEYGYIPYINKTRKKDRNKIVLFAKKLPAKFSKIGVRHYPWPDQWQKLPAQSKKDRGGVRQRFLSSRQSKARHESLCIQHSEICPTFIDYLKKSTGTKAHEIRHMLFSDIRGWEEKCCRWYSSPEAQQFLTARRATLDAIDKEFKDEQLERRGLLQYDHELGKEDERSFTCDDNREPILRETGSARRRLRTKPSQPRHTSPLLLSLFKCKTSSKVAPDRPRRPVALHSRPKPLKSDKNEPAGRYQFWFVASNIRLPQPRSPCEGQPFCGIIRR